MKVSLLDPKGAYEPRPLPLSEALARDLGLSVIVDAMADGDDEIREAAWRCLLAVPPSLTAIVHRQATVQEALANPGLVRDLHAIALEAVEGERRLFPASRSPQSVLFRSREAMTLFLDALRKLRDRLSREPAFVSPGFSRLWEEARRDLDDDFFQRARAELEAIDRRELRFFARLGRGLKPEPFGLIAPEAPTLWQRLFPRNRDLVYRLDPRDEAGARMLSDLAAAGLFPLARVLSEAVGQVLAFFRALRFETAFLLGARNLAKAFSEAGAPIAFPELRPPKARALAFRSLLDPLLLLKTGGGVVGNTLSANGARLCVVTGANRGGKTTFLRSLGLAQLLANAGLFVPAEHLAISLAPAVFSHFRREEVKGGGRLDDELARLAGIVDQVVAGSLLLMNESFASTYEHEGAALALEVVSALTEAGVRVVFVTHLREFALSVAERGGEGLCLLHAEVGPDGRRTFRMREGLEVEGHARSVFERIFGPSKDAVDDI